MARLAEELSVDAAEAEKLARPNDRERKAFIKKQFDRDIDDPCLYDLVINTAGMTSTEVVSMIWQAARVRNPGI